MADDALGTAIDEAPDGAAANGAAANGTAADGAVAKKAAARKVTPKAGDRGGARPTPRFDLGARARSFGYAGNGIRTLLLTQHNAWIHAFATVVVVALGLLLGVSPLEWCALVLAIVAVWVAEALNTALEFLADALSPDSHPLVGKAKDVAAGGVLIAAIGSVVIGLLVLGPHCLAWLRAA